MTTNHISKFKEFMTDLGMWEQFMSDHQNCQGAYNGEVLTIDDFLATVEPSAIFDASPYANNEEWQTVKELWNIEFAKGKIENVPAEEMDDKQLAYTSTLSGYKFCTRCYQLKPLHQFNNEKSRIDGYSPYCKDCNSSTDNHAPIKVLTLHEGVYSQNRVFLSKDLSTLIKDKDLKSCKVMSRKGHIFLVFSKSGKSKNLKYYKYADAYSVSDIEISKSLTRFFRKTVEDAFYLHLSKNTSKKDYVITIEVLKVYSPEDYKSIRFIRKEEHPMVQKKEEAPVDVTHVVDDPGKKWNDMTSNEKIDYLNSCISDPNNIIPEGKFDMMSLLCDYLIENYDHSTGDMTNGEKVMATTLTKLGWKLQKPVRVIKYEEFRI